MVTLHGRGPHSGRAGLAAVALVAAVLTLGLPMLSYRSVTSLTQGQQQVGAGASTGADGMPFTRCPCLASLPTLPLGSCLGS